MNSLAHATPAADRERLAAGTVRAVTRALALLKAFEGNARLQLRDVAEKARLDRGTARRLLVTLMAEGMVVQNEDSGLYSLGPMIRRLAGSFVDTDLRQLAAPRLQRLATDLGLTVFLSEYRDHSAVCLARYHDRKSMEVHVWAIGGTLPLNCGGAPKLLLAWQSAEEIDHMLARPLSSLTGIGSVDRRKLRARLKLIRKRGWEMAADDVAVGLCALAVPLLTTDDQLRGCLSVGGLTHQMGNEDAPVYLGHLLGVAAELQPLLH